MKALKLTPNSHQNPYHEIKASPTLSQTVKTATKILQCKRERAALLPLEIICRTTVHINGKLQHTSTGTKSEDAQSRAYSFQRFCSTRKLDKHSQKPFCQHITKQLNFNN